VEVEAEEDKFEMDGLKLKIKNVAEENLGIYRCYNSEKEEMGSFQVDMSIRLKQMPKSISIDEGSSTVDDLKCSVMSAGQEVDFKWFSRPEAETDLTIMNPICSKSADSDCSVPDAQALFEKKDKDAPVVPLTERSKITTGEDQDDEGRKVPYSVLTITDTHLMDRQTYICLATLKGLEEAEVTDCQISKHCDQSESLLRVKDPLAAVWPFCGIVVEVVLLCLIIFFCERNKSNNDKEEYGEGSNGDVASNRNRK